MKGLILGQNPLNQEIEHFFSAMGWPMRTVENTLELRRFTGQVGGFTASLPGGAYTTDFVVVTQPPSAPPPCFGGREAHSLYMQNKPTLCKGLPPSQAVAFLLDAVAESPLALTVRTLLDAEALAKTGRPVYFYYRSVRRAGRGTDDLFRRAQEAGAILTRYTDISVKPYEEQGFTISAQKGGLHSHAQAGILFADGAREMNEPFRHCLRTLRLWPDTEGRLPEEKYFLAPVRSSRRGVFLIGRDLAAERLEDGLRYIASYVATWQRPADKSQNIATVQGERCAFCYTCYRACPHGALTPATQARQMSCLPAACEGCGNCVSVCPAGAIQLETPPPRQENKSGRLLVFCCQNSAALALPKALTLLQKQPNTAALANSVDSVTLPCGGSLGLEDVAEALLHYEKVLVATCMEGACRHFEGAHRARLQCGRLQELLATLALPASRLRCISTSHALPGALKDELEDFLGDTKSPSLAEENTQ